MKMKIFEVLFLKKINKIDFMFQTNNKYLSMSYENMFSPWIK